MNKKTEEVTLIQDKSLFDVKICRCLWDPNQEFDSATTSLWFQVTPSQIQPSTQQTLHESLLVNNFPFLPQLPWILQNLTQLLDGANYYGKKQGHRTELSTYISADAPPRNYDTKTWSKIEKNRRNIQERDKINVNCNREHIIDTSKEHAIRRTKPYHQRLQLTNGTVVEAQQSFR